jgi:hypothetical protein
MSKTRAAANAAPPNLRPQPRITTCNAAMLQPASPALAQAFFRIRVGDANPTAFPCVLCVPTYKGVERTWVGAPAHRAYDRRKALTPHDKSG